MVLVVVQEPLSDTSQMGSHEKWDFIAADTDKCVYIDWFSCFQGKQPVG